MCCGTRGRDLVSGGVEQPRAGVYQVGREGMRKSVTRPRDIQFDCGAAGRDLSNDGHMFGAEVKSVNKPKSVDLMSELQSKDKL